MKSSTSMNRRNFLKKGTSGLAGIALLPGSSSRVRSRIFQSEKDRKIITRKLGGTGFTLPVINMGVMNADNPAVMQNAYDLGIKLFDTAWRYQNGRNERMVGQVIKEMGIRDKIVLATKVPLAFGNHSSYTIPEIEGFREKEGEGLEKKLKEDYLQTFEESLQRLQQNYVDILYVHSVKDPRTIELPFLLEAITQLKKEGKVRFLGVSSHQNAIPVFKKVLEMDVFDVVLACLNFKMPDRENMIKILNQIKEKGLGVIAMKTQAIYSTSRITHHTAALKYVLRNDFITTAIPGFTTFAQLKEDFSVVGDLEYTPEEEKFLNDYWNRTAADPSSGDIPCQGCETCLASCPKNVSIPDLMRTYMYASGYGNFEHARITYETIPPDNNLKQCQGCSSCTASCINGINIPSNIRQLKALFA
ncbi:MAG: aldo/keto reductase [Candidatus Aminicenantes bacterium]|nr:aldo/keto reductase [Candidatus Aminicenantes bacterium]